MDVHEDRGEGVWHELLPFLREGEWCVDRHRRMLAVVIEDAADDEWSVFVVSPKGATEAMRSGFATCDEACSTECAP